MSSRSRLAAVVSFVRFPAGGDAAPRVRLEGWSREGDPSLGDALTMGTGGSGADRCPQTASDPDAQWGGQEATARGAGREGHSPCSSLLAAAHRVEEVLPLSALGVPGRLLPRELPPDGFRSLLGGVFFFFEFRD